ncbi:pyrimidine/purine nucleoside phosphorylase [Thiomicrorhabdus indica]|uniref:pyrimidine/purine nucleoside phosphorylase n=1 Tax=Thiomicrorhabdus indica TaxID=2267253 RepID=UPI00102DD1F2|nr:pyrimidine/purine nucleoside phosphorylase [Thiomicrorhabdus indica]
MSEFNNVTVVREANIYFDGKVTSRKVIFEDGSYKTLGLMMPGEYEFGTEAAEIMEFLAGHVEVLLPGQTDWQTIKAGDSFEVPANSKFGIKVLEVSDYCCTYITE